MKTKATTKLLTHRTVAAMCDLDTETLREWVAKGEFPEPHAVISQTWFYSKDIIDHWLETGRWPEGARFKGGRRGRA